MFNKALRCNVRSSFFHCPNCSSQYTYFEIVVLNRFLMLECIIRFYCTFWNIRENKMSMKAVLEVKECELFIIFFVTVIEHRTYLWNNMFTLEIYKHLNVVICIKKPHRLKFLYNLAKFMLSTVIYNTRQNNYMC